MFNYPKLYRFSLTKGQAKNWDNRQACLLTIDLFLCDSYAHAYIYIEW